MLPDRVRRNQHLADAKIGKTRLVDIFPVIQGNADLIDDLMASFFPDDGTDQTRFIAVNIVFPQYIPDVLYLPGHDIRYVRMEKVIMEYLELVFDKYEVSDKNYICVTRNADISPDDEAYADNEDFRYIMKETLHKRRRMAVRVHIPDENADETGIYIRYH